MIDVLLYYCCEHPVNSFCICYIITEFIFYIVFRTILVPKANVINCKRRISSYRFPYGPINQRHVLLERIVERIIQSNIITNTKHDQNNYDIQRTITTFLLSWFVKVKKENNNNVIQEDTNAVVVKSCSSMQQQHHETVPFGTRVSTISDSSNSSDTGSVSSQNSNYYEDNNNNNNINTTATSADDVDDNNIVTTDDDDDNNNNKLSNNKYWTIPGMTKSAMDDFLIWAMFGKDIKEINNEEGKELNLFYNYCMERLNLKFYNNNNNNTLTEYYYQPRRLSLEYVKPLHRPLLIYIIIIILQYLSTLLLLCCGFQRISASKETKYYKGWYRPAKVSNNNNNINKLPLLFFHGIAPGGLVFYLPMILYGILKDDNDRACFLFDNPNISCKIQFYAYTEQETVQGVKEILKQCLSNNKNNNNNNGVALCGHSFGSCPLTWLLLDDEFRTTYIRQLILLDPVTILLSEPDVMISFLYPDGDASLSKIRLVASSELFTEYYLRRHFAWYNSELWIDEINNNNKQKNNIHTIIALAENDEIVNAPKVKQYLDNLQKQQNNNNNINILYWKNSGHAACVTDPMKWKQIRNAILQSEINIIQNEKM